MTSEERIWLREFFHDVLFKDPGAYVLYGTKPMSWSCIDKTLTDEEYAEMMKLYQALPPEEKALYFVLEKDCFDFQANFEKWKKIRHKFPITQYLFGTFPIQGFPDSESLFFINIEMTLRTLLNYHEDFKRVLGFDFDPFQAVFEVENRDSRFWNGVIQHHVLLGILLGFGRENAWFFDWKMQYSEIEGPERSFIKSLPRRTYEQQDILYPNPKHFGLPIFGSYGLYPNDQKLIEQYRKEQKKIKALYKNRDEVDVALDWLTRSSASS